MLHIPRFFGVTRVFKSPLLATVPPMLLWVIFCYCPQKCALVSYFHIFMKIPGMLIYHRPSHVFSYKTHCYEQLIQHLVICANLGSSNVWLFKKLFRLSNDAIIDNNWCFCFFTSYTVDDQMLYKDITTLPLSPLSSLLVISSFWGSVIVTYFLLAVGPFYWYMELSKPLE